MDTCMAGFDWGWAMVAVLMGFFLDGGGMDVLGTVYNGDCMLC